LARPVPAVTRSLDILELFLEAGTPLTSSEIVARLGLPRTSVHELLATLEARSYLSRSESDPRRYELGFRLLQLGSAYASSVTLIDRGRIVAAEVAARCDETVHVAILEGADVVYIAKVESTQPVRMVSAVGLRLPANCTAVGKMILSGMPDAELDALFAGARALPALTPRSVTSLPALKEQLAEVRQRGFAEDRGESQPDVSCVAAPIRGAEGSVIAAISISVPSSRWSTAAAGRLLEFVLGGARTLSELLGDRERHRG
jgi:IclR family KDG regulon transcriptional repressor